MSYVGLCGYVVKVYPLTVFSLNYALCAQNHTEGIILGEGLESVFDALNSELLGGLTAEAGEHLVGVMMVVSVVMATARAMLTVVVVVMMVLFTVMVMLVVVAVALFTVMVMLVVVTVALFTVMVVLVVVAVALFIVMVMLVVVAVALFIVMVMIVIVAVAFFTVMVMLVMLMLLFKLFKCRVESILLLHCGENILAVELVPRGGNDGSGRIMLSDKLNALLCLMRFCGVGMRKNDAGRVGNLVVVELAKVLHIHLALINVGNCGKAVESSIGSLYGLNSLNNVRELSDTAGLDDNSVGVEFVKHLDKRLGKIANERATDATGVHLGNLNARILKESAVNTDLTKLVFDKNELFTVVCLFDKLLYKCGFSGSEETGENIYFRHIKSSPLWANLRKYVIYYNYTFLTQKCQVKHRIFRSKIYFSV